MKLQNIFFAKNKVFVPKAQILRRIHFWRQFDTKRSENMILDTFSTEKDEKKAKKMLKNFKKS
jgi:hypothetical protein